MEERNGARKTVKKILAAFDANKGKSEIITAKRIAKYANAENEEIRWLLAELLFWDHSAKSVKILYKLMEDKS